MSPICRALLPLGPFWLLAASQQAHPQDATESKTEPCDPIRCYEAGPRPLTLDDGTEVKLELQAPLPIVSEDRVLILPGATLFLEGDVVEGKLINLRPIAQPTELENVLQVRMWQESGHSDTYLRVTNHFHQILKYKAAMLVPRAKDFHATSTCAVLANGKVGYETWPQSIFQLVLANFVFAGDGEVSCQ
jgi:hypothetical protein